MEEPKVLKIDDVEYVRADQHTSAAQKVDGMEYVIVRTYSAGVHAGYLQSEEYTKAGRIVKLINARRLWYWSGAATLSQLAMEGTSKPDECKFPCEVNENELTAIEVIPCTEKARLSIKKVPIWKA